ncbi:alkaline phosphatase family protein [Lachnoclostridium edouardi]|uniref:alkaline phosphatase family protein n=1 Tax=Lachnoclostridium edouardi TaxID=1926283 RepID=UPI000C7B0583|nr:alkaline phosphatase family protein [Lachnoclostridium edouardi]
MDKAMILVIDGCAPEYLTRETAPDIYKLADEYGFAKIVKSAIPSVTNVNHACILSGKFPEDTKMVGNYFYNPETKEEGFIEEKGFMKAETILQAYKKEGKKTAFLTVKGKVLGVYGEGVDIGISVQTPDKAILDQLGLDMPPKVQDHSSTEWIMKAALACVKKENPDFVYCTTNDFVFHHFGPETSEAKAQIRYINYFINEINKADPDRRIYITADHGMNQKTKLINFQHMADNKNLNLYCLPPLKDRYVENHIYQEGGIIYVFLDKNQNPEEFLKLAKSVPEIEKIMTNTEAAKEFHLPADRIGDYVLFAAESCAFGEVEGERLETNDVRTHGSLYERNVPLITIHPEKEEEAYNYSKDIAALAMNL